MSEFPYAFGAEREIEVRGPNGATQKVQIEARGGMRGKVVSQCYAVRHANPDLLAFFWEWQAAACAAQQMHGGHLFRLPEGAPYSFSDVVVLMSGFRDPHGQDQLLDILVEAPDGGAGIPIIEERFWER